MHEGQAIIPRAREASHAGNVMNKRLDHLLPSSRRSFQSSNRLQLRGYALAENGRAAAW